MATMKPNDAAEVLRKLRERLESADQDFSDDERTALDLGVQGLRHLEGFTDARPDDG
jgi:hypothetical protein